MSKRLKVVTEPGGRKDGEVDSLPLLIAIATALPVAVRTLRDFVAGRRVESGKTLRIEVDGQTLELRGVDDEEQQELVEQWLNRLSEDKQ